jgi:hypothetical protein
MLLRITAATVAVRAVVFVAAVAALWAAVPSALASPRVLTPVLILGLMPALFPNSGVVTGVMLTVACGWMFGTLGLGESVTVVGTFMTAAALYLLHSFAALAAALPYDAIVDTAVLLRWATRASMVLAVSAAVTALVVVLAQRVAPTTSTVAILAGFGVVAGTVWLLARKA